MVNQFLPPHCSQLDRHLCWLSSGLSFAFMEREAAMSLVPESLRASGVAAGGLSADDRRRR